MMQPLDDWTRSVDVLCRQHLACSWQDLSGDPEPLAGGYEAGQTPMEFVRWFAEKYDLAWVDTTSTNVGSRAL